MCTLVYFFSIVWINFHSCQWYNFDIYADAYVAKLMAEEHTLFPRDWIFGNQYYVIATPVLAALIQVFIHDSVLAMGIASSLMMVSIFWAFVWCCKPFFRRRSILTGLFCLSGAVILGTSASSSTYSFQIFYTMASYYACYVLGVLFHLGLYLRLRRDLPVKGRAIAVAVLMNIAFGMQSLRETLVLNIPLLVLELLCWWKYGYSRRTLRFVLLCMAANLLGLGVIRLIPTNSNTIISPIGFLTNGFSTGLSRSVHDIMEITGLRYISLGWKWRGLFLFSLVFWAVAVIVLFRILRKKDLSPAALPFWFSTISLFGVFVVGVFFFPTRPIYYFMWFLVLTFAFTYFADQFPDNLVKKSILVALILCGIGNYVYNFYTDYKRYPLERAFYHELADQLLVDNIDCLYVDLYTMPTLAACSKDEIVCGTFEYDFTQADDHFFTPVSHLQHIKLFEHPEARNALVVLSDSEWSAWKSWDYIDQFAPDRYREELLEQLIPVGSASSKYYTLYFYRFAEPERMFG